MNSTDPNQTKDDGETPWLADLLDIRVMVFLVCILVVAMTATILLFSKELPQVPADGIEGATSEIQSGQIQDDQFQESQSSSLVEGQTQNPATVISERGEAESKPIGELMQQASDASIALPITSATLVGCAIENASNQDQIGITKWQQGGHAAWQMKIEQRRSGFFYCLVTYRAKEESQFYVQIDDGKPRRFSIYPTNEDFEERFIVRLGKREIKSESDIQTLKLIANELGSNAEVTIRKIELLPQK